MNITRGLSIIIFSLLFIPLGVKSTHIQAFDFIDSAKKDSKKSYHDKRSSLIAFNATAKLNEPSDNNKEKRGNNALLNLTPAQQYASEILSYLLKVVLGKAGDLNSRKDWATRGLDEKLDLKYISEIMQNPEMDERSLMVLDWSILPLINVLYHYDKRLSLHKGRYFTPSIYPAPEFLAIRLLLLQKIHQKRKINLQAFIEREELWTNHDIKPTEDDLKIMNLTLEQAQLIKDIVQKEPHLYSYLKSPFLVKTLFELGAVDECKFVKKKIHEANYNGFRCRLLYGPGRNDTVKIAILPSMIKEFYYGECHHDLSPYGFKPSEDFNMLVNKMKNEILKKTEALMPEKMDEIKNKISFYIVDERPLVIYPDNAKEVIKDVCPGADFTIIILDMNVYQAIHFDENSDIYPHVNWFYMDLLDIRYSEIDEETDLISRFIISKLKP